ncbi:MAG: hypothetical protein AB7E61_06320 [Acholeplasmataceae bacterium]
MKNKLSDLNNHLFAELERLGDEEITGEKLEEEIHRANAIVRVSTQVINNARVVLDVQKHVDEFGRQYNDMPEMLQIETKKE